MFFQCKKKKKGKKKSKKSCLQGAINTFCWCTGLEFIWAFLCHYSRNPEQPWLYNRKLLITSRNIEIQLVNSLSSWEKDKWLEGNGRERKVQFSSFFSPPCSWEANNRAKFFRCNSGRVSVLCYTEGSGNYGIRNVLWNSEPLQKKKGNLRPLHTHIMDARYRNNLQFHTSKPHPSQTTRQRELWLCSVLTQSQKSLLSPLPAWDRQGEQGAMHFSVVPFEVSENLEQLCRHF